MSRIQVPSSIICTSKTLDIEKCAKISARKEEMGRLKIMF
jgi:hypothetical protein